MRFVTILINKHDDADHDMLRSYSVSCETHYTVSTSEWGGNRHTAQYTSPISVVSQHIDGVWLSVKKHIMGPLNT